MGWFKVWDEEILDGSIASESPMTQLAWIKVLALANLLQFGPRGTIALGGTLGFPDGILAKKLGMSRQQWGVCKAHLARSERILVHENNVITLPRWHFYQSEYQRQSPYRTKGRLQTRLQPKVTDRVTSIEEEVEVERRSKKEEEELLSPSGPSDPEKEYDLPY